MDEPRVLIVGAGPTGLNLALRLARDGLPFRIIDAHDGPGQESRALIVHARTLEFYRQIGLADAAIERGLKVQALHIREGGKEVAHLDLGDIGQGLSPYPFLLEFPQDEHERFLIEALQALGVEVERGVMLTDFAETGDGVQATLQRGAGASETVKVAYLCGCDGARSTVRERLGLAFPGGTYAHLYYVADVGLAEDPGADMEIHLDAGEFALMMPVRSRGAHRLIGIAAEDADAENLRFEDVQADAERLLGVKVKALNWFSTYRVHHRVADRFRVGRCFVLGDAGHLHSPAGGQGMNTGIGDAVNLGWKLSAVLRGCADPAILDSYEPERIAFARTLVRTTDVGFRLVVSGGLGGRLLRTAIVPHLLPFAFGFQPAKRALFETVSQVRIAYPDSPLSEGRAGEVRGGDRLPWTGAKGPDNFAPRDGRGWRVQVHGAVEQGFAGAVRELGLPQDVFAWSEGAERAGLARDGAYLVRPDGHVGLALKGQDGEALSAYAARLGLKAQQHPSSLPPTCLPSSLPPT